MAGRGNAMVCAEFVMATPQRLVAGSKRGLVSSRTYSAAAPRERVDAIGLRPRRAPGVRSHRPHRPPVSPSLLDHVRASRVSSLASGDGHLALHRPTNTTRGDHDVEVRRGVFATVHRDSHRPSRPTRRKGLARATPRRNRQLCLTKRREFFLRSRAVAP